jgi:predicted ABC-class ATPase
MKTPAPQIYDPGCPDARTVSKEKEPITPFVDKILQLKQDLEVSTILVMGGSGDYFEAADRVIMMMNTKPIDVTDKS